MNESISDEELKNMVEYMSIYEEDMDTIEYVYEWSKNYLLCILKELEDYRFRDRVH